MLIKYSSATRHVGACGEDIRTRNLTVCGSCIEQDLGNTYTSQHLDMRLAYLVGSMWMLPPDRNGHLGSES
jgi:hypothetical protein